MRSCFKRQSRRTKKQAGCYVRTSSCTLARTTSRAMSTLRDATLPVATAGARLTLLGAVQIETKRCAPSEQHVSRSPRADLKTSVRGGCHRCAELSEHPKASPGGFDQDRVRVEERDTKRWFLPRVASADCIGRL